MQADRLSNCLVAAVAAGVRSRGACRLVLRRNRCGRWHVMWRHGGRLFEFYAKGRASKPYWRNVVYRGTVREVKA